MSNIRRRARNRSPMYLSRAVAPRGPRDFMIHSRFAIGNTVTSNYHLVLRPLPTQLNTNLLLPVSASRHRPDTLMPKRTISTGTQYMLTRDFASRAIRYIGKKLLAG